ncbi:MAG: DNA endonuclease SmrA [Hahellaceae bacterium]|nr:DNA endonuclease SmrA [Hahellaceae bacterium]
MDIPDETELFFSEMKDVAPLKQEKADVQTKSAVTPGQLVRQVAAVTDAPVDDNFLAGDLFTPLGPNDVLEFRRDGVQLGVYKKLRLGKYDIEARLDLHKLTVEAARREVFNFIRDCYRYGLRTVIILHGKGERTPDKVAVLKSYLAKWLPQIDEVMAMHSAQRHHGGTGAVYVLLKKTENERQNNRERHGLK